MAYDFKVRLRRARLALGALLLVSLAAAGQAAEERTYRMCILDSSGRLDEPYYVAFDQRLRELGFIEGRNLVVSERTSAGHIERLPELAHQLGRERCDVFVAPGNEANAVALERATTGTPIVVIAVDYDPEATHHVASLARPGGRVTGVSAVQSILPAKRLELMKELLPGLKRVAVLSDPGSLEQLDVARGAASRIGIELQVLQFKRAPYDYEAAFNEAGRGHAEALLALGSANFVPGRATITRLAREHELPSMFHHSVWADAGGLLSYGPNFSDVFRLGAEQVARVLRGANPAELSIEQPTRFELVVNLKTARAIGVAIPQSFLLRADKVIE